VHRARLVGAIILALVLVLVLARLYALAALAAFVLFVVFAVARPPARYRRHGWGQIQQAGDHRVGIIGRSYPEDGLDPLRTSRVGRNDACPCGSGDKYKRCCGAS
jgi:hypothetical protein